MKHLLLCGALCACALPALAQNPVAANNGGVFQLPPNVKNVVSIDAQNLLIIESEVDGQTQYTPMIVKHVYSGGIARLFGGSIVPTAQFVTPGAVTVGQNTPVATGVNGNGIGNNSLGNNQNFSGGNFNGNNQNFGGFISNAITRDTFNGQGAWNNGVFNGTLHTGNAITNLQIRPR